LPGSSRHHDVGYVEGKVSTVAQRPSVRWKEGKQRWMAWVRFPDGSRRKVERVDKAEAERDLNELLALRAEEASPGPRRLRLATFDEVIDGWVAADCPKAAVSKNSRRARVKSPNTIATARYLLDGHVRPEIGGLRVDRTRTERIETVFQTMADNGYATSTIDHAWSYLNQACQYAARRRKIKTNPVADVLLPTARPPRQRKSFTIEQVQTLLTVAIPKDPRPALWLTGLMCGLRPGELTGLRWPLVDIDSDDPHILVHERANEINKRYVGQARQRPPGRARSASIRWLWLRCGGTAPRRSCLACTTPMGSSSAPATARRSRCQTCARSSGDCSTAPDFPASNGRPTSCGTPSCPWCRTSSATSRRWPTSPATRHQDHRGLPPRRPRDTPPRDQRLEQPAQA
jgi:integrase